jgi:hypothetical protein
LHRLRFLVVHLHKRLLEDPHTAVDGRRKSHGGDRLGSDEWLAYSLTRRWVLGVLDLTSNVLEHCII